MKKARFFIPQLLIAVIILASNAQSGENHWPAWGGPNRDFTVTDAGLLLPDEQYELKVVWRKPLGSGYSAVSVKNGVAVTLFAGNDFDYAAAFSAEDGSELWRFKIDSTFLGRYGSHNGPISTPLLTDTRVVGLSAAGRLFALDFSTGELVWDTHLVHVHGAEQPFYGFATSPVAHGEVLMVETAGSHGNAITALDVNSGTILWQASDDTVAYQSPTFISGVGPNHFVGITNRGIYGLRPESGALLWSFAHGGEPGSMAAGSGNLVPAGENRYFLKNKYNGGILMQLDYANESYQTREVWATDDIKRTYIVPVYHDGYLYGYNSRIFNCVDVASGERVWRSRDPGDGLPIIVDGYLVVITKNGRLSLAPASPEGYQEVASLDLFDSHVWSPASLADGKLFLRSMDEIASIEIVPAATKTDVAQAEQGKIPGTEFANFVAQVEQAADKQKLIDEFMARQQRFPVIEGDTLVHFIYRGEADELSLLGDIVGWRYDHPMHRVAGTDLFYYSSALESDARLAYKFMHDLQTPIIDSLNTDRVTPTIFFGEANYFSMPDWRAPDHLQAQEISKTGQIDSLQFSSEISDSTRTIEVYLPHGYHDSDETYPVAYIHGGQGARQLGQMKSSLDYLVDRTVAPVIVVFLPTTYGSGYSEFVGRWRDKNARIFVEEIVPLIDRTYRTIPDAENRANIGVLSSGFMAFYATFKHPDMFSKLAVQSMYWDEKEQNEQQDLIAHSGKRPLNIYLAWSTYDLRSPLESVDVRAWSHDFAKLLHKNGYDFTGGEVQEGTGWFSWKNRTHKMFETLFAK